MLRFLLAATALAAAPLALAEDDNVFHYGFLEGSYEHQDPVQSADPAKAAPAENGFSVSGSLDLSDYTFFDATYTSLETPMFNDGTSDGKIQHRTSEVSLGAHAPLGNRADLSATGGYAWADTRGLYGFSGDPLERHQGATGSLGLHLLVLPRVVLNLGGDYSYIGRVPGWDGSGGLSLQLTHHLWIDGTYWSGQDQNTGWSATLRTMLGHDN